MNAMSERCGGFVGAVRHHRYFTEDDSARTRLQSFCERIEREGAKAFIDEEYPCGSGKAMIVNEVAGRFCLVDGNAHLVALVACDPDLTLARLVEVVGRSDFVRVWREGWESDSGQACAYDIYVPIDADVSRIPESRPGVDGFKQPPESINIVPACVAFDSPLFALSDRGRMLAETAACVCGHR
ncbi:hypothetical protein [Raoultibacter phocaeensis]|uniref:hypothetical protein n=1 Tax=Raoultibacter phocaeensis TaxID=2479841 RepID=UPI001117EC6F|nr:hypothetical protein [Raoultibacter phocaeensis]